MKKFLALFVLIIIGSCSHKKQGNMLVQGKINGLKKGALYLKKMKDTVLTSVDSISILGTDTFILTDNIKSPEVYFLTLDANNTEKNILFFGEIGTITINDNIDKFGIKPSITGSKNHKVLEDYIEMVKRFKNQQLDLIKENFDARKVKDEEKITLTEKKSTNLVKRRYLYATNFAINHADYEVAPYIALTDLNNATLKLLDTINNSLTDKVKKSLYGKKLQTFIDNIKKTEK